METTNIVDFARRDGVADALTDLLRTGAQQLIAPAVEAELASYLAQFADLRTEAGHAAVVRNGHHPERPFQTGIGPVSVRIPKVRSKDGQPVTFRSALVPPYVRRTKTLEAALPWLYLKAISSGEMAPALKVLLGPDAAGLSANSVSRLKYYLSGACKACCREGAIGPKNTRAGKKLSWMTSQSSPSGPPLGRLLCNRLPVNGRCLQRPSR
jgi:transposase-like protein